MTHAVSTEPLTTRAIVPQRRGADHEQVDGPRQVFELRGSRADGHVGLDIAVEVPDGGRELIAQPGLRLFDDSFPIHRGGIVQRSRVANRGGIAEPSPESLVDDGADVQANAGGTCQGRRQLQRGGCFRFTVVADADHRQLRFATFVPAARSYSQCAGCALEELLRAAPDRRRAGLRVRARADDDHGGVAAEHDPSGARAPRTGRRS